MTVTDMDRRETRCPVCGEARLIFITYAPDSRPAGKSVPYRCKDCTLAEARAAGEEVFVFSHRERSHLKRAWVTDQPAAQPDALRFQSERARRSRTQG